MNSYPDNSPRPTASGLFDGLPKQALQDAPAALLEGILAATSEGITIADARLPDKPIIFANVGFERLTAPSLTTPETQQ